MHPQDPIILERKSKIRELLEQGLTVPEVARQANVSITAIYKRADRDRLPTNVRPKHGAKRERDIIYMAALGYPPQVVGQMFKIAACVVEEIVEQAKARALEANVDATE